MKKFLFATFMGALVALAGCQQNDELTGVENTLGKKVSVTANIKANAQSRVALDYVTGEDGGSTIKVEWKESGESFLMNNLTDRTLPPATFTQTSGNQFEGTLPNEPCSYIAVYGDEANLVNQDGTLNEDYVWMTTDLITDLTQPIEFEHMTTILKPNFIIDGETVNESITKIVMDGVLFPTITGTITIEPSEIADIFIFLSAYSAYNNEIEEGTTFNFIVTADGKDYVAELSISQSMNAGKFYTADIHLEEIPYVTFTADAAQTFTYTGDDLQYSTDGTTFVDLEADEVIPFSEDGKLYLRGENNLNGTVYNDGILLTKYRISFGNDDVPVACTGDIRTLIDYATYKTVDTSEAQFKGLFRDCVELTSAPALPAETLAPGCYENMFIRCTSLEKAPELPATDLAEKCYFQMFAFCENLTEAPALPAETLAQKCYQEMFSGCTKLSKITMLATNISATDCLKDWVKSVAATGTFTKASSMTSLTEGVNGIPAGWTIK